MKSDKPDMTSFEKDIKQIFTGREFMPDTEAMWANIAPKIKRKNHGFTWLNFFKFFMSFALVMLVFFSALNYFRSGLTMVVPPSELSSIPVGQESLLNVSLLENDQPNKNNSTDEKSLALITNNEQSKDHTNLEVNTNDDIANNKLRKIAHGKTTNEATSNSRQKNTENISLKDQDNNISYNSTNVNNDRNHNKHDAYLLVSADVHNSNKKEVADYKTTTKNNQSNSSSKIDSQLNLFSNNNNNNNASITDNSILAALGLLGTANLNVPQIFDEALFIEELDDLYKRKWKKIRRKHGCYDFSLRKWRNEIDIYIGPDWTKKYLEAKSSLYEKNAATRIKTETKLEAFSLGLQYNLRHRSGLYGSIGLNYSQIDEKFELNSLSNDTTTRQGVIRIDIDSSGKITETMGDVKNHDIITWDKGTYNYYRFLSVPVTLGYGFSFYGFGIEPSIGIDFNFLFLKKGEILNARSPNIVFDNITSNHPKKADVYKSSVGFSGVGALKIVYPWSSRMDFFGETYIRYQLKSITVDDYPLEQKYRTIGLRLGARFKF